MKNVKETLEDGLEQILSHGERVSSQKMVFFKKKKKLCQEVQDQIDPYLSTFYDVYSMASYHTKPFVNPIAEVPKIIEFLVETRYISEGEEDNVKVEILNHPDKHITFYMWKELENSGSSLYMRYKVYY